MSQTILFLASDPDIRRVICKALESEGYYVESAGDVGTAEDWLKRLKPDLLMVRHYTESISGYDAAVFLRNACPGIPVLMVGGLLDDIHLQNREALKDLPPARNQAPQVVVTGSVGPDESRSGRDP
jgi:DNA-binding response OmpR family regulator